MKIRDNKVVAKWVALASIAVALIIFCAQQVTLYVLLQEIASWAVPTSLLAILAPALSIWTAILVLNKK